MRGPCTLCFLVFLFFCIPLKEAFGQDYTFKLKSIGVDEGMASRNVNVIFQDKAGFMWFGTEFGLSRYDASKIITYNVENGSLNSNQIDRIVEDGKGYIWLQGIDPNSNGEERIQILNPTTGKSKDLAEHYETPLPFKVPNVKIMVSYFDDNKIWIVTRDNRVFYYDIDENGQQKFILAFQSSSEIKSALAAPEGVWVSIDGKIILLNSLGQAQRSVTRINPNDNNLIAVDTDGEVYYYDLINGKHYADGNQSSGLYNSALGLAPGSFEFWTDHRLIGFDPRKKQIWANAPGGAYGVYSTSLDSIYHFESQTEFFSYPKLLYFDHAGTGWANHEGRISIVSLKKSKFTNFLTDVMIFGINGYGARGLYFDESKYLYTNGLGPSFRINVNTGSAVQFGPSGDFYNNGGDLALLKRLAIAKDKNGHLWYTDEGSRLAKLELKKKFTKDYTYNTEEYQRNSNEPDPVEMIVHWSAHFDRNEKLWLGKQTGLVYLDEQDSTLKNFQNYGAFPELRKASIFDFHENDEGIWIGASTGLYLLSLDGNVKRRFHSSGVEGEFIPSNIIADIREDDAGFFWIASKGGGLIKLNPSNGEYEQFTSAHGLSDDVIYASYEDAYGYLWLSSNTGIMRISKDDFSVSTYLQGDGLIHEEFNTGSHVQAADGRIFFGSLDGVTMFDPKDFIKNDVDALDIRLTGLEMQSKKTGTYSDYTSVLLTSNRIDIRPEELGFKLDFSLLDFVDSEFNVFSYRLEGLDAGWNYIDQPSIRINALQYGSYTLRLRGQGPNGQWSREISIPITVLRPFYLQWWFFVLLAVTLVILVYSLFKYRLKNLRKNQEKLEREVEERTKQISEQAEELREMDRVKSRFFANVSHELRTPLTLILGPVSNLLRKSKLDEKVAHELQRVHRNGHNMSNLVEEILDLSKLDAKKLTISEHPTLIKEFFEVIFNNFLSQADYKKIDYKYQFEGDPELTVLLDQRLVDRIVNNLLSNAFKFTSQTGAVLLNVIEEENQLIIEVDDNGIGISEKDRPHIFERFFQTKDTSKSVQGGTGIGLAMSKELSILLGGNLSVQSNLSEGSLFTLELPKKVHHRQEVVVTMDEETNSADDHEGLEDIHPSKTSLLLVEDNADMQEFISEILHEYHSVDKRFNGKEALDFLSENNLPNLIISDLMMPEMDGLEFLKHVRENPRTADLPMLMLTARSAEEDKLEAFTLGIDDYLLKPFSVEELKARLKNLLKNAESKRLANIVTDVEYSQEDLVHSRHEEWLKELKRLTQENVTKIDFNIASIAEKLGLSERQFQRNLKKITGLTPVVYLKEIRLQMARTYLENKTYLQVKDVAQAVGFSSTPYFSKQYQKRFGKRPSEYLETDKRLAN